jgi:flagellar biosynthesis/type III secretory pathway M-ring protein FliF/YscJ
MPTTVWGNVIFSVTPTILVGLIFWFAMRAIIRADRNERTAYAKIEAEERAKLEREPQHSTESNAQPL